MRLTDGRVNTGLVHMARVIAHPNVSVGDFSHASSFYPPEDRASRLATRTRMRSMG